MKLRSLELRNYRRHQRTVIDWPDGVIAVLGRNGAGKSSLLESIGFALFGVPATRTGKDLLRWDGAGPMDNVSVALEFELAGEAIRIHRELRGKGLTPSATLTVDGRVAVDPGAGSNEAVTQEIERRFGMDRDTFYTTLVANQGDLDRLGGMSPAKRKQLLLEMLGIDALDRAIERARQHRRDMETRIDAMRQSLPDPERLAKAMDDAKQRVAEAEASGRVAREGWENCKADLQKATADLAQWDAKHTARQSDATALSQAATELQAAQAQLDDIQTRLADAIEAQKRENELAEMSNPLPQLEADLRSAEAFAESLAAIARHEARVASLAEGVSRTAKEIQAKLDQLEAERAQKQQQAAVAQSQLQSDSRHLAQLDSLGDAADCPTCMQPLESHLPALQARLKKSQTAAQTLATELADALPALDAARAKLRSELDKAAALERAQVELNQAKAAAAKQPETIDAAGLRARVAAARSAHEERLKLHAAVAALPRLQAQHAEVETRRKQLAAAVAKAEAELAKQPDVAKPLEEARRKHAAATEAERDAERTVLGSQNAHQLAAKDLEVAAQKIADSKDQIKRVKETEEEGRYWAALASGRGKGLLEAFKAHLVGRIGPAIGREASRLIERFTGGRYTEITLDSEYGVYVTDGGKRYALDRFSGGESDLVHLAIRLAVSRLLVERSSAEMRFLALDEVFGSLDEERRHLVLAALQELGSLYSQVMLVTHHDSLRDALDASLLVEERDGAAVVSLHGG